MKINGQTNPLIQSTVTKPAGGVAPSSTGPTPPPPPPTDATNVGSRGADSVQISDAGRTLASESDGASATGSLTPERVSELRRRVLEGAYNSTNVVDQVARRILDRGDA